MPKANGKGTVTSEDTRTYLVERQDQEDVYVTVPASYKVTFGPVAPGMTMDYHDPMAVTSKRVLDEKPRRKPWVLRFYETKDKQRMLIQGVTGFRDLSLGFETASERLGRAVKAAHEKTELYQADDELGF